MRASRRGKVRHVALLAWCVLAACPNLAPPSLGLGQLRQGVGTTVSLVPTSDQNVDHVVGIPDSTHLYLNVDDGTSSAAADDNATYVRSEASVPSASHTVGFSGAPAGTAQQVTVNFRASVATASSGSVKVLLYDGATLLGTGPVHTLGAWQSFSDVFSGLSVTDVNRLQVKTVLQNTGASGAPRTTQLWIDAVFAAAVDGGSCVPATCSQLGKNCGPVPDGCGHTLSCGTCVAPEVCGGGPVPNLCAVPADPILAAAGNIACAPGVEKTAVTCHDRETSDLLVDGGFNAVLVLGDSQDFAATRPELDGGFEASWGRVATLLHPVPGNREYRTPGAAGYFSRFGALAGDPAQGYYSFDLGAWHLIALNTNDSCRKVACGAGSAQELWLKADLQQHPNLCTLAFWHHPRFSSGDHGSSATYDALWRDLWAANVDVVLNAHDGDYERLAPVNPEGNEDPVHGIQGFIVGTGGLGFGTFPTSLSVTRARSNASFGVLKLVLHPTGYDWEFLPAAGSSTYQDKGTAPCH